MPFFHPCYGDYFTLDSSMGLPSIAKGAGVSKGMPEDFLRSTKGVIEKIRLRFVRPPHIVPTGAKTCQTTRLLALRRVHCNAHSPITRPQPRMCRRPLRTLRLTGDAAGPDFSGARGGRSLQVERAFPARPWLYGPTAAHCLLAGAAFLPLSTVSVHLRQAQRHVSENVLGAHRLSKPVFKASVKVRGGMAYMFPLRGVPGLR